MLKVTLSAFFLIFLVNSGIQSAHSASFSSCPSKAFLVQQNVAQLYGVNLVTGQYSLLSGNLGTSSKINAVGFNFHDNYIYGWGHEWGTIVRIGDDFQAQPLEIDSNPGTNFFVGDIALSENSYFVYKKNVGLFKISLDENSSDYLVARMIGSQDSLSISIYDFAFHPENSFAYSVDNRGGLHKIDVNNGSSENLGNVGQAGTFGAVYFDVEGNFYISRNNDGGIFIIDVKAQTPEAEFFAYGPSSNNNDGARCATAPIVDESVSPTVDYGDAPDSYRTSLENNGARHSVGSNYLGSKVDAEYNAQMYPSSDENSGENDDDGVVFITPLISGMGSLIQVSTTGGGYVNVWVDFDQNGEFSIEEKLVTDYFMYNSSEIFLVDTPIEALTGYTWARVRLSIEPGIIAYGGVTDGEVEDYRIYVTNSGLSQLKHNTYFIAFEDNWPEMGDYDMNDVVIKQKSSLLISQENEVNQLEISGELTAYGAAYANGYAIQIDGVSPSAANTGLIKFEINGVVQETSLVESGTDSLVLMISNDLSTYFSATNGCSYYQTQVGCASLSRMKFSLKVPFNTPIPLGTFPSAPFNPFIFAKPNTYHGDSFYQPGRSMEIHLKNKVPTSKMDSGYFGLASDRSDLGSGYTYQTENGLPWALAINPGKAENWRHPLEKVDLLKAYPMFQEYVETSGSKSVDWYLTSKATSSNVYNK
ncbi:LruC domain-containing protein [Thalassotalea sp. M1531]|uniref:LruC domain-containing protein n=1 Tax=Thalassotalea algicola TaxID=2716224 RepID=A0A7Y0Q8F4_9GAMM|nr:LruC domain-containing protein [Thalassotalea algicola]NMP32090.1 LruC domain-containing protein [Thalassotalea algicola]